MCRGHSENGTWHDGGVKKCHSAFLEAYNFGDDQVAKPRCPNSRGHPFVSMKRACQTDVLFEQTLCYDDSAPGALSLAMLVALGQSAM